MIHCMRRSKLLSNNSMLFFSTKYINHQNLNEFYHALDLNILQEYVEASRPHAVNTAWAMLTLVYGGQVCILQID